MKRPIERLQKFFSIISGLSLVFNSILPGATLPLLFASPAYAQEVTPTESPTETPTVEPTATETVAPTPDVTQTITETPTETPAPTEETTPSPTPEELSPTPTEVAQPSETGPPAEGQILDGASTETPAPSVTETATPTPTITPEEPEQGQLAAAVLQNVEAESLNLDNVDPTNSATITTDKADYAPTDTAVITGTGFKADHKYDLTVKSDDQPATSTTVEIETDDDGTFVYAYQLDGIYRPNYQVIITNKGGKVIATTTFTDSVANTIDQCQNGGIGDPLEPCSETAPYAASSGYGYEGNANANHTNSHWAEGNFVPMRIIGTEYSAGAGNIQFSIDVTKGGKHAYDYVGSFDATETTGASSTHNANHNNPVGDIISGADPTTPDSVGTIPAALLNPFPVACGSNTFVGTQASGEIKAWGTSGPLTVSYISQNVGSSDCTTTIQVAWTATKAGFGGTIVLAFAPHIASQLDWGTGNSAISISGSPYHTSLVQYSTGGETKGIGQQDAKLAASAVIPPSTITIHKVTSPVGGTGFGFTTTGGLSPSTFGLNDAGTQVYTSVVPGSYTITEDNPSLSGYALTGLTCGTVTGSGTSATPNLGSRTVSITIGEDGNGNVDCTYTNTIQNGHIIVDKVTNPTGVSQSFNFDATGGTYADFNLTDAATPNDQELLPGSYTVSETVPSGWDLTNSSCVSSIQDTETPANLELDAGETITCTFTNTKRGHIIVDKVTNPSQSSQSFDFTAGGTGYTNFSLTDAATPNDQEVVPGAYSVSEGAVAGWDSDGGVCDKDETPASLDVEPGETVTCTFTNTQRGSISGYKYEDANGDGVNDSDWTPVVGWVIELWKDLVKIAETPTDSNGYFSFTNLVQGTYQLIEQMLTGWTNVTPTTINVALVPGEADTLNNFVNTQYGTIIVIKQTDPDGSQQSFDFDLSYGDGDADLADGQQDNSGDLLPGTYSVVENTPAGWDLLSATCSDGSNPSSISLQSGETVTCTFTNQQDSGIVVIKQTIPDGSLQNFEFDSSYHNDNFFLQDGFVDLSGDLVAGTYSVSELTPAGWNLTSAICDDGSDPSSINLSVGETVTCTFTNTQKGHLIVQKTTIPAADPNIFSILATGSGTITGGGAGTVTDTLDKNYEVTPGTYSVTETVPGNWIETSNNCDDVVVAAGATEYCQIVNTKRGNVTVVKYHDHNINGVKDPEDEVLGDTGVGAEVEATRWEIHLVGPGVNSSQWTGAQVQGQVTFSDIAPNTYTLSEQIKTGWLQSNISCTGDTGIDNDNSHTATVSAGQTTNCAIGNYQKGTIIVEKQTDPDASAGSFEFDTNYGSNFFLSDGQTNNSGLLTPGTYSVSEIVPAGWDLTSATCSDQSDPSSISLQEGETVTCTFTNQKDANIVVVKQTDPDGSAKDFEFESDYGSNFFLSDGESSDSGDLDPDTYSVTELTPTGWTLDSATCDDESDPSEIDLEAGETVTCTFNNSRDRGNIVITKLIDADNDLGTTDDQTPYEGWVMDVDPDGQDTDDPSVPATDTLGETTATGIKTGTYWVNEDENGPTDNYHFLDSFCTLDEEPTGDSGSSSFGGVEVAKDKTTYCTFINARDRGTLIVHKLQDTDGDGSFDSLDSDDFTWGTDGSTTPFAMGGQGESLVTDFYDVYESDVAGYQFEGWYAGAPQQSERQGYFCDWQSQTLPANVEVTDDQATEITLCNKLLNPILTITKENNTGGANRSPGDSVLFTITVTATQSAAYDVLVTDLPAGGFTYRSGSWTSNNSNGTDLKANGTTTEPTYASPGVWKLGTIQPDETVTLTYLADISNDQQAGRYYDLAWAVGCRIGGESCDHDVYAGAINPGFVADTYVGTEVPIVTDKHAGVDVKVVGEVLGASTELPATGANAFWLYIAFALIGGGLTLGALGWFLRRKYA